MRKLLLLTLALSFASLGLAQTIPWCYDPTNQAHPVGNNYMEFQDYSGGASSYYHDGIDIMSDYGQRPVYSSNTGVWAHTSTGTMYGGLMIGEHITNGEGWLYWHIPSSTMQFSIGDSVYAGDFIGRVATWSVSEFHHVHFNKIVGTGGFPWSWYSSTDNPFLYLDPYDDPDPPYFRDAVAGQTFAFAQNGTSNYLNPDQLTGQVDIIANIGDIINDPDWPESPFQVRYWIDGPGSVSPTNSFYAAGLCPSGNTINVCYQEDATCTTQGNYNVREYFFNVTNTDGDSTIELSDTGYSWNTDLFPAGDYWIFVEALDRFGNSTLDSMQVTLTGGPEFSITFEPVNPPIIVPAAGGNFDYDVTIANTGGSGGTVDVWIMATLPNSSQVGPLLLVSDIFIAAGATIERIRTQTVPPLAPAGEYYYEGRIGEYSNILLDSDGFNFTKSD